MITYNHELYVEEAIKSFLMQKITFPIEIIIAEDCSTDRTKIICSKYFSKYPEKVRLITSNTNVGPQANFIRALNAAKGKYVAYCDGDDYWTDPYKLQKQVDFLESNDDYSTCFHYAKIFNQEKGEFEEQRLGPLEAKECYSIDDLLESLNCIPTCSVVFRNKLYPELPAWYYKLSIGDYPLHILNALKGKIGLINEDMSVYRRHKQGVFSGGSEKYNLLKVISTHKVIGKKLKLFNRKSYKRGLLHCYYRLSILSVNDGKRCAALKYCLLSVYESTFKQKKRVLLELIFHISPNTYKFFMMVRKIKNEVKSLYNKITYL